MDVKAFAKAVSAHDGQQVAHRLAIPALLPQKTMSADVVRGQCRSILSAEWTAIAVNHVEIMAYLRQGYTSKAFESQRIIVTTFLRLLNDLDRAWLPVLYVLLRDLYRLAIKTERLYSMNPPFIPEGEHPPNPVEDATRLFHRAFTACLTDRDNAKAVSRKHGIYRVVGMLFCGYFRLNQHGNCKSVLRALDAAGKEVEKVEKCGKADQVVWRYRLGCLAFSQQDYLKAEKELTMAFKLLPTSMASKRELVLLYLIPTRMLLGRLISPAHLEQYAPRLCSLLSPFFHAIRTGNPGRYHELLLLHEPILLKLGIYLAMEQGVNIAFRVLVKRTWKMYGGGTRLPMSVVDMACGIHPWEDIEEESGMGEGQSGSVDTMAVECLLAGLVGRGWLRGYLSNEKRMVVLSGKDPFPSLASLHMGNQR